LLVTLHHCLCSHRETRFSQHQNCLIEINKLFLTVTANVNKAVYAPVC
jgi:hypothetical protein